VPIHEMTDEERYLAQPRHGQLVLTTLGWALGGLATAWLLTIPSAWQEPALALFTGTFGAPEAADGAMPWATINFQGVVVFGMVGLLVGFLSSFLTDLLYGIPKIHLRLGAVLLVLLWMAALGAYALAGVPFAAPVVGGLMGWMRAARFSATARGVQAGVWAVVTAIGCAALGVIMILRPDLGTVVRFG